ncbi:uncharacterized protein G2W53_007606 [Senna tora]|uniref:Uncharacterized protein n=1 Tax=Senna tora TaxID=362788 RepID=A0A834X6R9_9FABA|nr:uncharacterized protein G2W53_007606 [Senna tora]
MCCCTSESNRSLCIVFGNPSGFNAPMALVIAWKVCQVMSKHILKLKSRLNLKRIQEVQVKRVVAKVNQTDHFMLYFRNPSGLNAPMGLVIAWKEFEVMS